MRHSEVNDGEETSIEITFQGGLLWKEDLLSSRRPFEALLGDTRTSEAILKTKDLLKLFSGYKLFWSYSRKKSFRSSFGDRRTSEDPLETSRPSKVFLETEDLLTLIRRPPSEILPNARRHLIDLLKTKTFRNFSGNSSPSTALPKIEYHLQPFWRQNTLWRPCLH